MPEPVLLRDPPSRTRAPGLYLDVDSDPGGRPVEFFLIDPPIRFPVEAQILHGVVPLRYIGGVASRMTLTANAPPNVIDWISQGEYPNVADFLEDGRVHGFSRPFGLKPQEASQLTDGSLIVFLHARGFIENWADYGPIDGPCPKTGLSAAPIHMPAQVPETLCCGYWWEDIEQGDIRGTRRVRRILPGGLHYDGRRAPPKSQDWRPRYQPGLIARMPIGGFSVVGDPEPWQPVIDALKTTPFPVRASEK